MMPAIQADSITQWRPKIGDSGFEVEWCADLPVNEYGDCEPDLATYCTRDFRTIDEARQCAKQVFPQCVIGEVRITPFTIECLFDGVRIPQREYTGDGEFYHG